MIQAGQGKNAGPYPQNNYSKKDWGVAQVAEHLPSKVPNKTLSSTPVTRAHTHTHTHTHTKLQASLLSCTLNTTTFLLLVFFISIY
jgi:hypothetical protein